MKLLTTVAVLLGLGIFAPQAAPAEEKANHLQIDTDKLKAAEEYWTEERLKNATPLPLPTVTEKELAELLKGRKVDQGKGQKIEEGDARDAKAGEVLLTAVASPGVPTKANVGQRPFWNGGKLFFTKPGGKDYTCSAQFVGQNDILLTAAHCVKDGNTGVYYTNFAFRRAYKDGGGQKVGIRCVSAWYMWASPSSNHNYDYAFLHTSTTSGAGWLGIWPGVPFSTWTSDGYPANYGKGKVMYQVLGSKGLESGGIVQMLQNPMTQGSSGGAWIGALNTSGTVGGNYAIGLNSFGFASEPGVVYGPLFDGEFIELFNKAVNNCQQ